MRCWYCDKKLGFFHSKKNLFCSPEHEELYKREQQDLLVERVLGGPSDLPSVMGGPAETAPAPAQNAEAQKKASRGARPRQTAPSADSQPQPRDKRVAQPAKDPKPADFLRLPIAVRSLTSNFRSDPQLSPELARLSPQLPQVWLTPLPDPAPEPVAPEPVAAEAASSVEAPPEPAAPEAAASEPAPPEPAKDTPPPLVERPIVAILLAEPKPPEQEELHCQACDALTLEAQPPVRRHHEMHIPALALRLWQHGFLEHRPPADTTHKLSMGRAIRRRTLVSAVALPSAPVAWRGSARRSLLPANQTVPVSLEPLNLPFTGARGELDPSTAAPKPSHRGFTQNSTFQPCLKTLAGLIQWRALPQAHSGRLPAASRFEGGLTAIRPTLAFHEIAPSRLRIPESSVRPEADIMEQILADCDPSDAASLNVISAGSALHMPARPERSHRTGALEFLELVLGWAPAAQDFAAQTARAHREMETAPAPLLPSPVTSAAAHKSIPPATCPARAELTELSADPPPVASAGAEVAAPATACAINRPPAPSESTLATGPLYGLPPGEPAVASDVPAVVTGQANATAERIGLLPSVQPPPDLPAVLHLSETASIRCIEVDAAFTATPSSASVPPASVSPSTEAPAAELSSGLATAGIRALEPIARRGNLQLVAGVVASRVPAPDPRTPLAPAAFTMLAPRGARVERFSPGAGFAGDEAHRVPPGPASVPARTIEAGPVRSTTASINTIVISELLYKSAVRVEASAGVFGSSIQEENAVDWHPSTILPSLYHDAVTAQVSPCRAETRQPILGRAASKDTATAPVESGTVECHPGALAYPPLKVAPPRYSAPLTTGALAATFPAQDSSAAGGTRTGAEQSQPVSLLLPPANVTALRPAAPLTPGTMAAGLPPRDSSAPSGTRTGAEQSQPVSLLLPPANVTALRPAAPLTPGTMAAGLPPRDSSTPSGTGTGAVLPPQALDLGTAESQAITLLHPPAKVMPARQTAPRSTGAMAASLLARDCSTPGRIKTGAVKPRPVFDLVVGSGTRGQLGTCAPAPLGRALNLTSLAVRPGDVAQTWTVADWPMPGFSDAGVVGRLGTIAQTAHYILGLAHMDRLPAPDPWLPRETVVAEDQASSRTNVPPVSLGNSRGLPNSLGLLPAPRPEHADVRPTGPGLAEQGEACLSCAAEAAGANSWLLRPVDSSLALPLFVYRNGHPHVPSGRPVAKHPYAEAAPIPAHVAKPLPRRRNLAFPVIRMATDAPMDVLMSALQTTP